MENDLGLLDADRVVDWFLTHGLRIGLTVLALAFVGFLVGHLVPRALRVAMAARLVGRPPDEVGKRVHTLSIATQRTIWAVLSLAGLLIILPEVGVSVGPVLASAGIVGLAVGIGAQSLVRDALNGFLILSEDQYRIGDVVTVAGVSGTVEDVSLRRTVLRDSDGTLHWVPNSSIVVASNHSRGERSAISGQPEGG